MIDEQQIYEFLEVILGFSKPWKIEKLETDVITENLVIYLSYPKGTKFICPECGKECSVFDLKYRDLRHLDFWQYKTTIMAKTPRIECCGKKNDFSPFCKK